VRDAAAPSGVAAFRRAGRREGARMNKHSGLAEYLGFVAAGLTGAVAGHFRDAQALIPALPMSLTIGAIAGFLVALLIRALLRRQR
jgi:hypothetical protein